MFSKYSWKSSQFNIIYSKVDFRFISALLHAYLNEKEIHMLEYDVNVFESIIVHAKYRKVVVKNVLFITEGGE